jgi:hypothetical protein
MIIHNSSWLSHSRDHSSTVRYSRGFCYSSTYITTFYTYCSHSADTYRTYSYACTRANNSESSIAGFDIRRNRTRNNGRAQEVECKASGQYNGGSGADRTRAKTTKKKKCKTMVCIARSAM